MTDRPNHNGGAAGRHASIEPLRKLRKLGGLLAERRYRDGLRNGVAAATEHERIPYRRPVRSVIDVGAHQGQFALFALKAFPDARIHCFEPLPAALAKLAASVGGSDRVNIVDRAASDAPGEMVMHVSRADDSSSLLPIGDRYVTAFPGTEEADRIDVAAARVDEQLGVADLPAPVLLKVDVQGFELEALRGCTALLPAVKQAVIEVSFLELYVGQTLAGGVTAFLVEQGFELTGVFNLKQDRARRCLQADFLFTRPEAA